MDVTALARSLLDPIPAHRTAGLEVVHAADGAAEVTLLTTPALTNVIGSLYSGGLITLADAAGLAAIISAWPSRLARAARAGLVTPRTCRGPGRCAGPCSGR